MNVNIVSNKIDILQSNFQKKETVVPFFKGNTSELPSIYPLGQSQLNSNLPISYSLIGEISIPGLKDKARIYKLANGQRVVIAPKKGSTVIKTTYNTGSINERDNIRGISHFIEHNLFNGSKELAPKEYDKRISYLGAYTNASTNFNYTDYYLQLQLLHENSLEEAIKLNAMLTQFPTFPNEQLIKEKEPVKSEIDMVNDDHNNIAFNKAIKNLFKIQSDKDLVAGSKENINSFNRDTVIDYFNTWYTPDNAVTVITGDVNPDETINLAAKYYNKQNDYSYVNNRYHEPLQYNDKPIREDIIQSNTTKPSITMCFAIKEGTNEKELNKIEALFSIINSTNSSFYKALDSYSSNVRCSIEKIQNKPNGAKAIIITANAPEEKLEDVLKVIYSEITNISNNSPSLIEVENMKKRMINEQLSLFEDSQMLNYKLTDFVIAGNYDGINSSINIINNIMPSDISETARKYLDLNKVSMCISHHKNSTKESINNQYQNSKQVSFGRSISPLQNIQEENSKIQEFKLSNNIESTILNSNPYAKSCICIEFNTEELNKTNFGTFMILNEMLDRGSSFRSVEEYNSILNSKDISMSMFTNIDGLNLTTECSTENLFEAMSLIKEKILYPNLTEKEFLRAKQVIKDAILTERISPHDKLYQEFYPEIKMYEDREKRLQELEQLTLSDIKELYTKILSTSCAHALMSAPLDNNPHLQPMFNNELIGLGQFKPFYVEGGINIYKPNKIEKILTTPTEKSQADIAMGYKFKKSKNINDIAKIDLLNIILGAGGMSSRLFCDLRENKKLAYSVNSKLTGEKDIGILSLNIGTTTQSPNTKESSSENITKSIDGFYNNVARLKTENVSDSELENAKNIYKTNLLNRFETNMSKSILYKNNKNSYYGKEFNEKLFEAIDKINPDDIRASANYIFENPPVISICASKKTLSELNLI